MKIFSVFFLSFVSFINIANAADLATHKAPALSTKNWTGFHIGLNAGGTWGNTNVGSVSTYPITNWEYDNTQFGTTAKWATQNGTINVGGGSGFVGGGQVGYDWQFKPISEKIVLGIETDLQGAATGNSDYSNYSVYNGPTAGTHGGASNFIWNKVEASTNLQYIGTLRGRVGALLTPSLLVYGTGGLAYGSVNFNSAQSQTEFYGNATAWYSFPVVPMGVSNLRTAYANTTNFLVGYAAGGGVEWMFMPNFSTKVEYLYYDLGSFGTSSTEATYAFGDNPSAVLSATSWLSTRATGNIIRAGVNYHFNLSNDAIVAKF